MRRFVFAFIFAASVPALSAETVPDWFLPLRDAVYEQNLSADEIVPLYTETSLKANALLAGPERFVMLSRCEYMMGRAYQYEERKDEAAGRYSEGIAWAEKALEESEGAAAYQMLAENISQSCAVRPVSYAMSNGLKVARYAKRALEIEARNAAAQYMAAARWVFSPAPFHNYRKGIEMMKAILIEGDMDRDDRFNVYLAIGYAYVEQKKHEDAGPWLTKALEVYPTNKYARKLLGTR